MNNNEQDISDKDIQFVAGLYKENVLDTERAWQRFAVRHAIHRSVSFRRYWLAAASVLLLLLVGIGVLYESERDDSEWISVATAPGELKEVLLPDSTLISMAGSSIIRYDRATYGKGQRVVTMKGKALYQVVRNIECPFIVQTSKTSVTVLGTTFQVKANVSSTNVHVVSGQVSFSTVTGKNVLLAAGMLGNWSVGKQEIVVEHRDNSNDLSWKTKILKFKDTPLDAVINDLCEFYQVKIINRTQLSNLRLTATFNDMSLDEVLKIINQTLDIQLEVVFDSNK